MIQSLIRALDVLEALKKYDDNCTIAQLSEELELPPSTIHRILKTLCSKLYVVQDEKTHEYHLGPALIPLGSSAVKSLHLQKNIYPIMKKVATETGEDTFLMIPVENKGVVLERIDGPRALKLVEEFGDELYLHYGAIRKAILAFKSDEFIEAYIKDVIEKNKSTLKTTPLELREKLRKIREEGIANSSGDYAKGTIGIGVPIKDSQGEVIASLGIVVPKTKTLSEERVEVLRKILKEAGELGSNKMGYFGKR